jgi:hypothetical protein
MESIFPFARFDPLLRATYSYAPCSAPDEIKAGPQELPSNVSLVVLRGFDRISASGLDL